MTRLLLVILFTGPMKEMPPALKATGGEVGVGGCVGVAGTCVAAVVVAVVPVVAGCPELPELPATPPHAVSNVIITTTKLHISIL
jgi:hypothetical protein